MLEGYSINKLSSIRTGGIIMKRTIEKILTWVGILLQFLLIFVMALIVPFLNDESAKDSLIQTINNSGEFNQNVTQVDPSRYIDIASSLFLMALGAVIVCTIIALICALLINRLPKVVGVVLILIAIVTVFTFNLITALLWLIAGIMLLVRKPQQAIYENGHYNINDDDRMYPASSYQKENDVTENKDDSNASNDINEQPHKNNEQNAQGNDIADKVESDEHRHYRRQDRHHK